MAQSKLNAVDAQEWLESLQLVGEGWYRQVALAIRAGAHNALGMEKREFARQIGQKMIDPRPAIIDLHGEGHSVNTIASVLGMGNATVNNVLVEEGLIEGEIQITGGQTWKQLAGASKPDDGDRETPVKPDDGDRVEDLQAKIETLSAQVKGEQAKAKKQVDKVKDEMKELRQKITDERKEMKRKAEEQLTKAERERAEKEADAWAAEQGRKIIAGLAHLVVASVVGALEEAAEEVRLLIEQDAVTDEAVAEIASAHAGFVEEFNVARMSAGGKVA